MSHRLVLPALFLAFVEETFGGVPCGKGFYEDPITNLCQSCKGCCPPRPPNQYCERGCDLGEICSTITAKPADQIESHQRWIILLFVTGIIALIIVVIVVILIFKPGIRRKCLERVRQLSKNESRAETNTDSNVTDTLLVNGRAFAQEDGNVKIDHEASTSRNQVSIIDSGVHFAHKGASNPPKESRSSTGRAKVSTTDSLHQGFVSFPLAQRQSHHDKHLSLPPVTALIGGHTYIREDLVNSHQGYSRERVMISEAPSSLANSGDNHSSNRSQRSARDLGRVPSEAREANLASHPVPCQEDVENERVYTADEDPRETAVKTAA